jgi:hypothetical protein
LINEAPVSLKKKKVFLASAEIKETKAQGPNSYECPVLCSAMQNSTWQHALIS